MAIKLLRQKINGKTVASVTLDSSVIDALTPLLDGEITVFNQTSKGGASRVAPANMNAKTLSCGKKTGKVYQSASFRIKHVSPAKGIDVLRSLVVNNFDANFTTTTKCEYCNLVYDKKANA